MKSCVAGSGDQVLVVYTPGAEGKFECTVPVGALASESVFGGETAW